MITAEMFEEATGHKPEHDDLERANCEKAGEVGHWMCGWCPKHNLPFFMDNECVIRMFNSRPEDGPAS